MYDNIIHTGAIKMRAHELSRVSKSPIIDYQFLMQALHEYRSPRAKVTQLLKKGDLIRVKKGLYVLAENGQPQSYQPEILANLIYGPSYISLQYALQYYQMLPERVETVTSVSPNFKKIKVFTTAVGRFSYRYQKLSIYVEGFTRLKSDSSGFLIAVPEKALADLLYFEKVRATTEKDLMGYLLADLRLDKSSLARLSANQLERIAERMNRDSVWVLAKIIRQSRRQKSGKKK
jgi:hypothetical protein